MEIDPSWARRHPAKYRKWSTASGRSAASVSRTGLPFSQHSATASISRLSSMRSAIRLRMLARSVALVVPQAAAAVWAASSASSTSLASERAISVNTAPVAGATFPKYRPAVGAIHFPPMKLS